MTFGKTSWTAFGSTVLYLLLWSSGGIFSRWALDHASAFVFLVLRFALAGSVLLLIGLYRGNWLPQPGTRWRVAKIGLLLIGGYSACYFLALEYGLTPGVLATVMGAQPLLTLVLVERRFSASRIAGLLLALGGLVLVVFYSLVAARLSMTGMVFALAALTSMTIGAILQKQEQQAPVDVLPLQYIVSLGLCLALLPSQSLRLEFTPGLAVSWLWLGLVYSVGAQLLFYRLIRRNNLVNVTSLFYLVPAMTAVMDYVLLGNALPGLSVLGMIAILAGLALVFRHSATNR